MYAAFHNVAIEKMAVALPSIKISYDDESYDGLEEARKQKLKSVIGFQNRYIVKQETTLDLCEAAARKLELNLSNIDALVFVTQTPDHFQPGNSYLLHARLALTASCFCTDINAGCNGYLHGLFQAHQLLQLPEINSVLLCVGDTISKTVNPADAATAPIFGDGGSATLLHKKEGVKSYFSFHSQGKNFDKIIIPNGAYRNSLNHTTDDFLYMDGAEVMQMAIQEVPNAVNELISKYQIQKDEIDYFFFHQANSFIISSLAKNLGLEMNQVPDIFPKYGNQSSASIPFAMAETLQNKVSQQSLLCGFGVGFAWATAVLNTTDLKIIV